MQQLNNLLFSAINQFAGQNQLLDYLFILFAEAMPYVFIALVVILWFRSKEQSKRYLIGATLTSVVGITINTLIAQVYFHPRPFMDNLGTTLVEHAANSSFPSDHTTFMFCIAFSLLFHRATRKLAFGLTALAVVGGLSRVYIGVHFPFDIAGAAIIGALSAMMVHSIRHKLASCYNVIISISDRLAGRIL
ncbi:MULTISPECIES: undecaprenyl-diphosphatase [unclassified Moritella]|uniref:undecaprenyl-diphosphatase n=1 Tax=unclassified Moritella TaxID=2637987 RepID=UPI001BAE1B8E|nr:MULTISPECIES: undecaprenyl-diphosphatase [unclassified Moritella]QUM85926.1 undecaprenyl-diphosphatase [Moritella sp. 28]QUM90157.1 undecaprenyl-diphosphatase [Moritella sp. 36]